MTFWKPTSFSGLRRGRVLSFAAGIALSVEFVDKTTWAWNVSALIAGELCLVSGTAPTSRRAKRLAEKIARALGVVSR